jgi:hypothetical protein
MRDEDLDFGSLCVSTVRFQKIGQTQAQTLGAAHYTCETPWEQSALCLTQSIGREQCQITGRLVESARELARPSKLF